MFQTIAIWNGFRSLSFYPFLRFFHIVFFLQFPERVYSSYCRREVMKKTYYSFSVLTLFFIQSQVSRRRRTGNFQRLFCICFFSLLFISRDHHCPKINRKSKSFFTPFLLSTLMLVRATETILYFVFLLFRHLVLWMR